MSAAPADSGPYAGRAYSLRFIGPRIERGLDRRSRPPPGAREWCADWNPGERDQFLLYACKACGHRPAPRAREVSLLARGPVGMASCRPRRDGPAGGGRFLCDFSVRGKLSPASLPWPARTTALNHGLPSSVRVLRHRHASAGRMLSRGAACPERNPFTTSKLRSVSTFRIVRPSW